MVVIDEFLGRVTFSYSDGRTLILEGKALNDWLQAIIHNQQARNVLESITMREQAEAEPAGDEGPKIVSLVDVLKNKSEDLAD